MNENSCSPTDSRRSFLKKSSSVAAAAITAPYIALSPRTFANSQTLKVGLIGCGGRGTGAAREALKADKNVVLTAVGDVFEKQITGSLSALEREVGDKLKVEGEFVGLDAYEKVINSG